MSRQLDFRARSVSEIVDGAFQLYRRDALHYILAAAMAYAPLLVLQLVVFGAMDVTDAAADVGLLTFIGAVVAMLGFMLMSAVLVHFSSEVYLGRHAELARSLRVVAPKLPTLVVAWVLRTLVATAGFFLFIVPGFILLARYFAITPVIVIERRGVFESLSRSSELSRGRKRHIFGTMGLVFLLYFLGSIALGAISGLSTLVTGTQVISMVVGAAYTVVAYPLIGITEMLIYYDTRIRAEAYDVEVLAEGLTSTAAASAPR